MVNSIYGRFQFSNLDNPFSEMTLTLQKNAKSFKLSPSLLASLPEKGHGKEG